MNPVNQTPLSPTFEQVGRNNEALGRTTHTCKDSQALEHHLELLEFSLD